MSASREPVGRGGVDLPDLRLFSVLAEELHFGRAAARLHLSQPGLSYRVQRLEEALGYPVVTRDRRGIRLTPGGARLLEGARRLLADAQRVLDDAALVAGGSLATVRVGVVGTALYSLVPDALQVLRRDHPGLRLLLTESKTTAQLAGLASGGLDLGVVHLPLPEGTGLTSCELTRDPVGLAVPEDWDLAAAPGRASLAVLADRPVVLFPRVVEPATYDRYVGACVAAGFAPRVAQEATGLQTILSLVAGGVGAAFVAESVAGATTRRGVRFVPLADGPVLSLGAACRAEAPAGVDHVVAALTAAGCRDKEHRLKAV
ncbi:MAG: LysR substrate-binding domain-containing protein [Kineosporiaceae bacterium]